MDAVRHSGAFRTRWVSALAAGSAGWGAFACALASVSTCTGCAGTSPAGPPAPRAVFRYDALDATLEVGRSTESEVVAVLGAPGGTGEILMPGATSSSRTLFYQHIELHLQGQGMDVHMDTLLVFIRDGRLAGYLWTTDAKEPS